MDPVLLKAVRNWINGRVHLELADLGSYNINGAVKDIAPWAIGFDLIAGPGVDVVLKEGEILSEHQEKYDLLAAISCFQVSENPHLFKQEVIGLLRQGGELMLSMCTSECRQKHSTSPFREVHEFRYTSEQAKNFFAPEIQMHREAFVEYSGHKSFILWGKKQ